MKSFVAIMDVTPEGRVAKYLDFDTEQEALDHVEKFKDQWPDAYVKKKVNDQILSWKVDKINKTAVLEVPVEPLKQSVEAEADRRVAEVAPPDKINQMLARAARLNAEVAIRKRSLTVEEQNEVDQLIAVDDYTNEVRRESERFIRDDLPNLTEDEKLNFDPATDITWPSLT